MSHSHCSWALAMTQGHFLTLHVSISLLSVEANPILFPQLFAPFPLARRELRFININLWGRQLASPLSSHSQTCPSVRSWQLTILTEHRKNKIEGRKIILIFLRKCAYDNASATEGREKAMGPRQQQQIPQCSNGWKTAKETLLLHLTQLIGLFSIFRKREYYFHGAGFFNYRSLIFSSFPLRQSVDPFSKKPRHIDYGNSLSATSSFVS